MKSLSRRTFLQKAACASMAVSAWSVESLRASTAQARKGKLGVALVGLGYYSTELLAPALQHTRNCYLAGIVTGTPAKAEAWKNQYQIPEKNIYSYQTFDQIANNPDIDVVYVVLPTSMHKEYVIRAAQAGKHVFCEKPMAVTAADCEAMIQACEKNKVKLAIGYRCQHDPNTQEYMRLGQQKILGKVQMITCGTGYVENQANNWKLKKAMGGGAMYDMGVYALQGARLVTGEEPIAVTAQHFTTRPDMYTEVDETTLFQLQFPSGAVAACHTSLGVTMNYLTVNCENGWIRMEPFSAYNGCNGRSSQGVINFPIANQQMRQMDNDAAAILQNKSLVASGREGWHDIRIVEAIYAAACSGKQVKL